MKERPILFSGEMVRAILEGRKTQTRRVVKPQPTIVHAIYKDASISTNLIFRSGDQRIHCPFGQPGDRLWVRETWGLVTHHDLTDWCGGSIKGVPEAELREQFFIEHAANWKVPNEFAYWRPSIHMPRWASRLTLEITAVRVERLQDIGEEDAKAEGVTITEYYSMSRNPHRSAFIDLWNTCYGPESWNANPWVWVIEFRRVA